MRVKTFRGRNTQSALAQVKAELGAEAVILDTQNYSEGGDSWCEITAALEAEPSGEDAPGGRRRPGWDEWHREWDQIKSHLLALVRSKIDFSSLSPRQRMPLEFLEAQGVGEGVLTILWQAMKDAPLKSILAPLTEIVPLKPFAPGSWTENVHVLAGPSGSGKTSSLIRLALDFRRAGVPVLVANADTLHGKGRLLLKHYAEFSGLPYKEIATGSELVSLLDSKSDKEVLFLDMPSLPRGMDLARYLAILGLAGRPDTAVHLVLAPHLATSQLSSFLALYGAGTCGSLIWTKLDEACKYGAVVNTAHATGLPASAFSWGAGLKGTLAPADRLCLWRLLFKNELPEPESAGTEKSGRVH
jgi:flagellar biosynthesis protein FlhF